MDYQFGTEGDYEPTGRGQEIRLIQPATCHNGHPVTNSSGFTPCPRCKKPTNLWWCGVKGCDGQRTSQAHQKGCPRPDIPPKVGHTVEGDHVT